jgi:hypothetical protein
LWPWTGFENEIGDGAGKGYNVNVPLPIGICHKAYLEIFNEIVMPLATAYNPDIFVLQLGMDALAGSFSTSRADKQRPWCRRHISFPVWAGAFPPPGNLSGYSPKIS